MHFVSQCSSTKSLGRAQTAQVLMSMNAIKEADLTTKVAWGVSQVLRCKSMWLQFNRNQEQAVKDSHIWVYCTSNDTCYIIEDPYCAVSYHSCLGYHNNGFDFTG